MLSICLMNPVPVPADILVFAYSNYLKPVIAGLAEYESLSGRAA
jgi:hypothetical protein